LASKIANSTGGIPFLLLNGFVFSLWIVVNTGAVPVLPPFDPYPFDLLTLTVSLEAILLSILVLLAQNLQAAKDRLRGEIEYEVNLKAELEVAELHGKLDHLHTELVRALRERNAG
jgi:CRP/FNR family transcriptional regulator, cyclic AMP receptor protein